MTDTTIDFEAADDAFSLNISPKGLTHSEIGIKSNFYAWHKPRKHWVRINQWNYSIAKLIKKLELNATTRPLNYLSLPGPDLLDIRAIQPICAEVNVNLRFLGLNSIGVHETEVAAEQALSISEVHAMSHIDPSSTVVADKFQHVSNARSVAYSRIIKDKSSFDVVNIDLCCSFAETKPEELVPDYYNAIFRLLRHQAETRVDDWLFFLTTRNNRDMVHSETIGKFVNTINEMLKSDVGFKQLLIDKNIFLKEVFDGDLLDFDRLDHKSFANSFLLGLGNWIMRVLLDNNPKWKIVTLPVFGYHVAEQSSSCDMMSLGFYCSRILEPAMDSLNLAGIPLNRNVQTLNQINEICFDKLIGKVEKQIDLDVMLYQDDSLYQTSLNGSAILLRAARYSEPEYRDWAENENKKVVNFLTINKLIS